MNDVGTNRRSTFPVLLLVCLCAIGVSASGFAQSLTDQVREDTRWLCEFPTRVVGTPTHDQALAELIDKMKGLSQVRVW